MAAERVHLLTVGYEFVPRAWTLEGETDESPIRSSTLITFPPGSGTRPTSSAPNARAYQAAAASASGTTMWALTSIVSGCVRKAMAAGQVLFGRPGSVDILQGRIKVFGPGDEGGHRCLAPGRREGDVTGNGPVLLTSPE